jgi:predicted transcriptional regulator
MIVANGLRKRKKDKLRKEKAVLRIIASKGGRVMPVEIAAETNLLLDEAQKLLNRLCSKGRGELKILKNGTAVYVFEEFFFPEEEKKKPASASS